MVKFAGSWLLAACLGFINGQLLVAHKHLLVLSLWRKKNLSTQIKTLRVGTRNQQQTQATYDAESGNRTWATLAGGECSHHHAIPSPPPPPPPLLATMSPSTPIIQDKQQKDMFSTIVFVVAFCKGAVHCCSDMQLKTILYFIYTCKLYQTLVRYLVPLFPRFQSLNLVHVPDHSQPIYEFR